MDMVCDIMKMRNILSYSEAGQHLTSCPISTVSGDGTNDLHPLRSSEMEHRATTDAVDSNAIDKVCVSELLTGADVAGEETEVMRSDGREPEPSDLGANVDERAHWKKCYGALWELKVAFERKNYR